MKNCAALMAVLWFALIARAAVTVHDDPYTGGLSMETDKFAITTGPEFIEAKASFSTGYSKKERFWLSVTFAVLVQRDPRYISDTFRAVHDRQARSFKFETRKGGDLELIKVKIPINYLRAHQESGIDFRADGELVSLLLVVKPQRVKELITVLDEQMKTHPHAPTPGAQRILDEAEAP